MKSSKIILIVFGAICATAALVVLILWAVGVFTTDSTSDTSDTSDTQTPVSPSTNLKVMTYNILTSSVDPDLGNECKWQSRLPKIMDTIIRESPDVVAFQEVKEVMNIDIQSHLNEEYNLVNVGEDVYLGTEKSGTRMYVKKICSHRLIEAKKYLVEQQLDIDNYCQEKDIANNKKSGEATGMEKNYIIISVVKNSIEYLVFGAHLPVKECQDMQKLCVRKLGEILGGYYNTYPNIVAMADWNYNITTYPDMVNDLRNAMKSNGVKEVYTFTQQESTRTEDRDGGCFGGFPHNPNGSTSDFILSTLPFSEYFVGVQDPAPSDHHPVIASL